jgi:tripartite-type tricarboxylate transporter receptor subunit TctC
MAADSRATADPKQDRRRQTDRYRDIRENEGEGREFPRGLADNLLQIPESRRVAMKRMLCVGLALAASLLGAGQRSASAADSGKAFFQGRTVRLIVGYSPGGGYDVDAHLIAPYLTKYLGTTVIVDNEPGAGGLRALDELYVAPPDGLTIMIDKGNSATMAQLTKQAGVRYDLSKFSYLGGTGVSPDVWVVSPTLKVKTVSDVIGLGRTIRWAATGPMDGLSDGASIICEALKLPCKVIMGYSGTNDSALALRRGEMDALITNEASANSYVESKNVRALTTIARKRSRYFPDLPTIYEATKLTGDAKWWIDFRANTSILGRILIAPPGVPPQRLQALQDAVHKALTDPQLIADGAKTQHYIEYQDPASIKQTAVKLLNQASGSDRSKIDELVTAYE